MQIAIDASRAASALRTGTEGYAAFLIRALIPLAAERDHTIHLYFNEPPAAGLFPAAAHVQTTVIPFPRLWTHLRLGWALRQQPPDVFFTPAHVIPITYRGRGVATVHDLGYRYFPRAHTRFQVAYLHWSTQHNAQRSQRVLADSEATKEDLERLYAVASQKIEVVYPAVDPGLAPVTDAARLQAVQERYGIAAPYLLYLGTLQPRKNVTRLVEAFVASNVTHQLVLAGKAGWRADPILQQIADAQERFPAPIRVTGYVDDADKAALLSGATALLFPSLYEGFGFPILEAQVCGTPVLCSDNSSLPEVAGDAALLVDAEDTAGMAAAIAQLVKDDALRQQLTEAGKANVARFTWSRAAAATLAALEAAVDSAAP